MSSFNEKYGEIDLQTSSLARSTKVDRTVGPGDTVTTHACDTVTISSDVTLQITRNSHAHCGAGTSSELSRNLCVTNSHCAFIDDNPTMNSVRSLRVSGNILSLIIKFKW